MKKLRFFNGRTFDWQNWRGWHMNIAAYSKADAARLHSQVSGGGNSYNEINVYFSECWGTRMQQAVPNPERGVYMSKEPNDDPIKKIA